VKTRIILRFVVLVLRIFLHASEFSVFAICENDIACGLDTTQISDCLTIVFCMQVIMGRYLETGIYTSRLLLRIPWFPLTICRKLEGSTQIGFEITTLAIVWFEREVAGDVQRVST